MPALSRPQPRRPGSGSPLLRQGRTAGSSSSSSRSRSQAAPGGVRMAPACGDPSVFLRRPQRKPGEERRSGRRARAPGSARALHPLPRRQGAAPAAPPGAQLSLLRTSRALAALGPPRCHSDPAIRPWKRERGDLEGEPGPDVGARGSVARTLSAGEFCPQPESVAQAQGQGSWGPMQDTGRLTSERRRRTHENLRI